MGADNEQANILGIEDELIGSAENFYALDEYESGDEESLSFQVNIDPNISKRLTS